MSIGDFDFYTKQLDKAEWYIQKQWYSMAKRAVSCIGPKLSSERSQDRYLRAVLVRYNRAKHVAYSF